MRRKTTKRDTSYVSVSEAATIVGVHRSTVWKWIRAGAIKVFHTPAGRVHLRRRDLMIEGPPHVAP